jgi:hypothetical protein
VQSQSGQQRGSLQIARTVDWSSVWEKRRWLMLLRAVVESQQATTRSLMHHRHRDVIRVIIGVVVE